MARRNSLEVVAKTLEEAIEIALKELDAERDEVEIEVVSRGRPGFLGFGGGPTRIRATLLRGARPPGKPTAEPPEVALHPSELASQAHAIATDLLGLLGVSAQAYLREKGDLEGPSVEIEGEDSGLLIGRRGETLQALQFLVNLLLSHRVQQRARVQLDVEGYKERRYRTLRNLARRMAERVADTGRGATLNPMPPAERRIVHLTLADHPRVITQSVGEGEDRKVTILPRGHS